MDESDASEAWVARDRPTLLAGMLVWVGLPLFLVSWIIIFWGYPAGDPAGLLGLLPRPLVGLGTLAASTYLVARGIAGGVGRKRLELETDGLTVYHWLTGSPTRIDWGDVVRVTRKSRGEVVLTLSESHAKETVVLEVGNWDLDGVELVQRIEDVIEHHSLEAVREARLLGSDRDP